MTTEKYIDIPRIVRETVKGIGYTRAKYGFDADTCGVIVDARRAVARHRAGRRHRVRGAARPERRRSARQGRRGRPGDDVRLRVERDPRADAAADHARAPHRQAAGRGAEVGRAPVPAAGRQGAGLDPLRGRRRRAPGARSRSSGSSISTQHREGLDPETMIKPDLIEHVLRPILPRDLYDEKRLDDPKFVFVNPTGKFVIGGPMGDTGLPGGRSSSTPTAAPRRTAAGRSPARIRRRSTARPPTRPATSRRTSSPPGSPTAARSRSPTRSASRTRSRSSSRRFGTEKLPVDAHRGARQASTSTCAPRRSCATSTCAARSTRRPPRTATSAATTTTSPWERTDKADALPSPAARASAPRRRRS